MIEDGFTGQSLAQYKIEDKLGQGGMGAVFRAWDTNLRRSVAIKILKADAGKWADRRTRFLMEARAVAALNHPNIVTIYEIGRSGELDYIAMEFVPGRTLHSMIHAGPLLPLDESLRYAAQMADAVAAAHAAGITHRDLKPANIMVTDGGRVKVLDFGVAKRLDQAEETDNTRTMGAQTLRGVAMGTPHYMSPEQAQGKPVDGRSDIFAMGAILYEMLTGRLAFGGDSLAAVMAAILTKDPPPVSGIRPAPDELDRLIALCLRKDLETRLQHAVDLKIALQKLSFDLAGSVVSSGTATAAAPHAAGVFGAAATPAAQQSTAGSGAAVLAEAPSLAKRRVWRIGGAAALIAAIAAGVWFYWHNPGPVPFAGPVLTRITADTGLATWPALSRDGRFLTYASDRLDEKNLHIWVQQLGGGQPIQLTHGAADDTEPSFSPDGTRIAFHSDRDGGGIYVVPTLGGDAQLLARHGRRPRFSPDGTTIAYSVGGDLGSIYLISAAGGSPPEPFQPTFSVAHYPIWSPDGKSILFDGTRQDDNKPGSAPNRDWWIAPVAGGPPFATGLYGRLRALKISPDDPAAWLTGDQLLFSGNQDSTRRLWMLRFSPRSKNASVVPDRLTFGTSNDQYPTAGGEPPRSARIVFSSIAKRIDLWSLPVDADRGKITGEMARLTQGAGTQSTNLSMSRDGKRIAFLSDRDGKPQPWIRDLTTGLQTTVASPAVMWSPTLSPDGRTLAWSVFENRLPEKAFRAPVGPEGQLGLVEALCEKCGPIIGWSPDGKSVTYEKSKPARPVLLELDSGRRYEVIAKPDTDVWGGRFSPDGKWITVNVTPKPDQSQIFIAPFDPARRSPIPFSEWIPITDGSGWDDKPRWSPDSRSMYFVSERDGFRCIWRQPLHPVTGRPLGDAVAMIHFHQSRLSLRNVDMGPLAFQVGPDKLVFSLGELTGNLWMLSDPE